MDFYLYQHFFLSPMIWGQPQKWQILSRPSLLFSINKTGNYGQNVIQMILYYDTHLRGLLLFLGACVAATLAQKEPHWSFLTQYNAYANKQHEPVTLAKLEFSTLLWLSPSFQSATSIVLIVLLCDLSVSCLNFVQELVPNTICRLQPISNLLSKILQSVQCDVKLTLGTKCFQKKSLCKLA